MHLLTASGVSVDIASPTPAMIRLHDIAHALSHICRFSGQCRHHYSVAQHSVLVSTIVWERTKDPRRAFVALLHDATEAYLGDVPTPVKVLLPDYDWIEHRMALAIAGAFGVEPWELDDEEVRTADLIALATERRDLLPDTGEPWAVLRGVSPCGERIQQRSAERVRLEFYAQFHRLAPRQVA